MPIIWNPKIAFFFSNFVKYVYLIFFYTTTADSVLYLKLRNKIYSLYFTTKRSQRQATRLIFPSTISFIFQFENKHKCFQVLLFFPIWRKYPCLDGRTLEHLHRFQEKKKIGGICLCYFVVGLSRKSNWTAKLNRTDRFGSI